MSALPDVAAMASPTFPAYPEPVDAAWSPLARGQVIRPRAWQLHLTPDVGRYLKGAVQRALRIVGATEIAFCDALVAFDGFEVIGQQSEADSQDQ